jgi:putative transposase
MKQRSYPTDLTDGEWSIIEPLLPPPKTRGSKRTTDLRKVVNAILYLLHEGCQWRALPHDFPPYQTVRTYFDRWKRQKIWEKINTALREQLRLAQGRKPTPSAASIDSQSVKTGEKRGRCMVTMAAKASREENDIF